MVVGITIGWHFINSSTHAEIGPAIGTAWVVNWFIIFPAPRGRNGGVAQSVGPTVKGARDVTSGTDADAEPVEQLSPGT